MLFEKRKTERRKRKAKKHKSLGERLYKLIFLAGIAIAFKGLKGWIQSKRR